MPADSPETSAADDAKSPRAASVPPPQPTAPPAPHDASTTAKRGHDEPDWDTNFIGFLH